ncbi:DNA polymerase III subunit gamma/tau [Rhodohalobacter barkolensis]|uniref:DNA polymerase III subunit gamma/tau n=1 Tax=Rhodohalobacter barkolensis TaxID=2053187 RepID=A0A2N0VFX2_9BACT|nr:DNA polymerase III subunit gamma/tau [Rhodohalobacter barkolensis]PKD43085.1 DNA polymerase III subunit gamma/tau [Rhodohalobacter barkolensis]
MADNYRALTRKYRPQTFDDIVSQDHVSSTLKNAIKQNRISHAYMFSGPRGVGKTTMARVLARTINQIDNSVDGESLNQTLNIVEIDAASNNKVEDVHQLRETVRIPPQNGRYKVFIIDEVHMLSKQAFNALLKTLEEPPSYAIFIFATTEPHKVLPTILSRVQRFDFKRISVNEIVQRLKGICADESITIDDESLHIIAKRADGALRDALGLMDQAIAFCGTTIQHDELLQALNVVGHDQLFEYTDAIQKQDASVGLELIDRLIKNGVDIQEFLVSLTEHLRNLYVSKQSNKMYLVEATEDTKQKYRESAKHFSDDELLRMLHLVSEAQIKIKDVQQPRVHFEILMLKLIHMGRTKEINQLISGLEQLKKNGSSQITANGSQINNPTPSSDSISESSVSAHDNSEENSHSSSDKAEISEKPASEPEKKVKAEPKQSNPVQSESAPHPAQPQTSTIVEEAPEEEDTEEDFLTIRPSLGYVKGISSSNGEEVKTEGKKEEQQPSSTDHINTLEEVEACWKSFLNVVKESAPQMLYFQILRFKLKELKGSTLIVAVDNEFATNLVDENQQLLSSLFKRLTGTFIRFSCTVEQNDQKKKESISPYERFKEIQKEDPNLRTIVNLFGAELEY